MNVIRSAGHTGITGGHFAPVHTKFVKYFVAKILSVVDVEFRHYILYQTYQGLILAQYMAKRMWAPAHQTCLNLLVQYPLTKTHGIGHVSAVTPSTEKVSHYIYNTITRPLLRLDTDVGRADLALPCQTMSLWSWFHAQEH